MATVIVEHAPQNDYEPGCVVLPPEYGTPGWEALPEVSAIRATVFAALDRLHSEASIGDRFSGRPVLVKPNLVLVYHDMGTVKRDYPETTDPRVFDAVIQWLRQWTKEITIVESSGRGSPTRFSFVISGIDRIAKRYGCGLVALEEQEQQRYIVPKATVQKEVLVPRVFSPVIHGDAAYVSVPKMKTNLYTGVTLGFKNSMGVIPYNLRQRNHTYAIDRKLVEMLYLFSPDMVVVDGIVGAEGECPAPVDPVDSRMIVVGDHPVETDRVATRLMGFDPDSIALMRVADELGFGAEGEVAIHGDTTPVRFRPADASLISDRVKAAFPRLLVLNGIDLKPVDGLNGRERIHTMESACRGGCIATTRFGLSMLQSEGVAIKDQSTLIVGRGVLKDGKRLWYDADGTAYDRDEIAALAGKKAAIGTCARDLESVTDFFVGGCMPMPNAPHAILHRLAGVPCKILSFQNKNLMGLVKGALGMRSARRRLIKAGKHIDVPMQLADGITETRELTPEEAQRNWVEWPLGPISRSEQKRLLAFEDEAVVASFGGELMPNFKQRLWWKFQAVFTAMVTFAPVALAALSTAGVDVNLSPGRWLRIFLMIELLHLAEFPSARKTMQAFAHKTGRPWGQREILLTALRTLTIGYPSWIPYRKGLYDPAV